MTVAMVTGASSGIGAAFARRLHASGAGVVLVGRDEKRLRRALGAATPDTVEFVGADLTSPEGVAAIRRRLGSERPAIDLVVHAAGRTTSLPFGVETLEAEHAQLQLNVSATIDVLHTAVTAMSARNGGAVIVVGSTASVWSMGSYPASKVWQAYLAQAIAARSASTGVRCLLVIPGFTRTELHTRAGVDASRIPRWMWLTPDAVAEEGLRALATGRRVCVPTWRYRALVTAMRTLPVRQRAKLLRRLAPLSPSSETPHAHVMP
jgi:short-subunit dehydrogenase